ncbi:Uncharacterized conserved protein, contains GH25 family domain [Sphingomonas laterariae]|uniref:Uncharacterized conserved protein, contains GH25 family domain n=1 Tax=Edaphosphingomonas laterariae TaxID=861865 RepID=A0A239HVB6_9SPHN|nr:DUF4198 domain-containing protein [Sphingomonas laterariae]SNS85078.1 Uncharacterized conserved protein, contains GH25 family domain [Sphingomonas laterariae]
MRFRLAGLVAATAALGIVATAASAHRQWMLPSSTIVSGDDVWVTVDAAVSNDLFYFEHQPIRLDNMKAWAPDGSETKIENGATGRYRSTFDVHLTQKGTYKIANSGGGIMGSYKLNGEEKRLPRGTRADQIATAIPAGATDVKLTEGWNRNEIFVTSGTPSDGVLKPTGKGLELVPVTHPNDLVAGEQATFRFVIDGKAASGLKVTVIPGGIRYRNALGEKDYTTDANGEVKIDWAEPGMYWLNASATDAKASIPNATERRLGYVTTLEVMAP